MSVIRKKMKRFFVILSSAAAILAICAVAVHYIWGIPSLDNILKGGRKPLDMELRSEKALRYAHRKGLDEGYCIFVDYNIPSGSPRLFVWSFKKGKVVHSGYVMHGPGKGSTDQVPVFSNTVGSKCSSLGRFEVTRHRGKVNRSGFRLKGLDRSNSNAFRRGIMIHRSKWVDRNRSKEYIPLSEKNCSGCVTVSSKDMDFINDIVGKRKKNLLLWSYCSSR